MNISELKVAEPYMSLFPIDEDVLSAIENNMQENGYDQSQPITIWPDRNIVIDGHTRLKAAQNIGLTTIPVFERDFADENAALEYAIHKQRDRRNLDDADILHLVKKLDKIYSRGGDRRSKIVNQNIEKSDGNVEPEKQDEIFRKPESSRDVTARLIGISADKVSQCRHVIKKCFDREIKAIRDGEKTLHQVYKSSLAAAKNEEKKCKEEEIRYKKVEELKTKDFPSSYSKRGLQQHAIIVGKLDTLVFQLLPKLEKRKSDMYKIRKIVESFKSMNDETFKIFCERVPVRRFLGSLFVIDFIAMLRCFGYKILTPCALKVIKEERVVPVKKKRPVPQPHCNIGRVHEVGFISNAERREMGDRMA